MYTLLDSAATYWMFTYTLFSSAVTYWTFMYTLFSSAVTYWMFMYTLLKCAVTYWMFIYTLFSSAITYWMFMYTLFSSAITYWMFMYTLFRCTVTDWMFMYTLFNCAVTILRSTVQHITNEWRTEKAAPNSTKGGQFLCRPNDDHFASKNPALCRSSQYDHLSCFVLFRFRSQFRRWSQWMIFWTARIGAKSLLRITRVHKSDPFVPRAH